MFRKKEKEFQYHPGIEKIIEDVQGGGTIARKELKGVIKELPPIVVVGRDENGLYHVVKTALIQKVSGTTIEVGKKHLFVVGEAVMIGGDLKGASDLIASIDKSNPEKDVITLAGAIGEGSAGQVLVLAKDKQDANSAKFKYIPEVVTMNKVDVTVANQQSGLLVRGTVNESVMPYPVDDAIKAQLKDIRFVYKQV
ncbi:hypothetical protein JN06_01339 [Bacteroides zoogleoformans]|uniref:Uncharacterized protein n=1 Tax=Bacteroides zoogleoformans TaxID=28119 RepID=A0ABM6T998_9BACE|nr:hypothetical protein [Bacteroides zoogleoformans]AVM53306.1 hypothetical protein C4H11_10530 [Bacteroides zoogleoformans]TWJ14406.1 hypothetical protein JN06_01339 [Bacteroides zoogleoformans]